MLAFFRLTSCLKCVLSQHCWLLSTWHRIAVLSEYECIIRSQYQTAKRTLFYLSNSFHVCILSSPPSSLSFRSLDRWFILILIANRLSHLHQNITTVKGCQSTIKTKYTRIKNEERQLRDWERRRRWERESAHIQKFVQIIFGFAAMTIRWFYALSLPHSLALSPLLTQRKRCSRTKFIQQRKLSEMCTGMCASSE